MSTWRMVRGRLSGRAIRVLRLRSSSHLRDLGDRAPAHPTESDDSAGTPRRALKPASRDPAQPRRAWSRCTPRRATLSLAPAADAANLLRTSESQHSCGGQSATTTCGLSRMRALPVLPLGLGELNAPATLVKVLASRVS